MKELFTIGEVGELFGINIRTLRYYDSIGLLKPEQVNMETGYRYYSAKQFERLNTIQYLRELNMPLEKMKEFFENKDARKMEAMLHEQLQAVREQKRRLESIEKRLSARLSQLQEAMTSPLNQVWEVQMKPRRVAFLRRKISQQENLEYPIRDLQRVKGLKPAMFLGKVGVSICAQDLEAGRMEDFSGIFVFLEEEDGPSLDEEALPGGLYLTIRYSGTHRQSGESYARLFQYMKEHGLKLGGDSVEITWIDAGFTEDVGQYVTELQVPVERRREAAGR